ncbi:C-type lectin domain family 4 member M [Hippoglossus stenolepis]|uniref:C-type lectin domain family 4 member M n=1 Tax=Hippoglossus stenolepis TaxID=195615 RepID=UPI0017F89003|nr:C-type lectin domain family 4 member M [Hippoglossus stenolepis]
MAYPEMNSNQDDSTGRKSSHHDTRSKGSVSTVRLGSRSVPLYPLVIVCLGVLNTVLLLTAVVIGIYCGKVDKESAPEQMTASTLFIEVKQLQFIQSGAVQVQKETEEELEKACRSIEHLQQQIEQNKTLGDAIQRQLETLHVEQATIKSSSSDIRLNCGRCPSGWIMLNESCYFHSKSESSALKSWANSREDCIRRGGDIAVIEDYAEQVNLNEYLPKLLPFREWLRAGPGIWIGFTLQAGDTWMWVNNVTLLGEGFWIDGEPNHEGQQSKNCGAFMNMANFERTWFGAHCLANKEWLCKMGPS